MTYMHYNPIDVIILAFLSILFCCSFHWCTITIIVSPGVLDNLNVAYHNS